MRNREANNPRNNNLKSEVLPDQSNKLRKQNVDTKTLWKYGRRGQDYRNQNNEAIFRVQYNRMEDDKEQLGDYEEFANGKPVWNAHCKYNVNSLRFKTCMRDGQNLCCSSRINNNCS